MLHVNYRLLTLRCLLTLAVALFVCGLAAGEPIRSHHAARTLEIYRHIVEVDTPKAAFYGAFDHYSIVLKTLAGRAD
ncbi:hypothetical protein DWB85_11670 [Seongchinamella sediminis]|uniref:Uncharacterized protein n=1 Tax=Seongchinamella sediminis TaxID=2283635 RepID=A0A3L7DWZ6_9GAMM|nr:hypothetical protein DWB85_11670 [Seongchinamella sediminis]